MKLSVNVITGSPSRYYRAGEEVPDSQISDAMRKYAIRAIRDDSGARPDDPGARSKPPPLEPSSKRPGKASQRVGPLS